MRAKAVRQCVTSSTNLTTCPPHPPTPSPLLRARCTPAFRLCREPLHRSPGNVAQLRKLQSLVLDKNDIEDLRAFPPLPELQTLSLNNNKIDDLAGAMDAVSRLYPKLSFLSLMRNPCSPGLAGFLGDAERASEGDEDALQRYRLYVIYRLPHLRVLDCSDVTKAEQEMARRRGQFMVTRKPSQKDEIGGSGGGAGAEHESEPVVAPTRTDQPRTFLAMGAATYDGRHSEGNRFIVNEDL